MDDIKGIGQHIQTTAKDAIKPSQSAEKGSFEDAIKDAIKEVSQIGNDAEKAIQDFATGEVKDIHTVVLAMEKADLSFQTLMSVRNKLLTAYEEIMRTPV
ncbi:MAG: flagellar hook-basal body complex protein FliE [Thermodesulfovibrionales bacterium]|nr:flagellar hook-basal body complex protein FliE [Thermodesulfovibrionales bacterium]